MSKFYNLLIFLCSIFLFSCNSSGTSKNVTLFKNFSYVLADGEKEVEKDAKAVKVSNSLKDVFKKSNLVLFKNIYHNGYRTFLFIDMDTIQKKDNYKVIDYNTRKAIFYQHEFSKKNEIKAITLLLDDKFLNRFAKDSVSSRFKTIK